MSRDIQVKILGRMGNAIIQMMVAESLRIDSGLEVNISLALPSTYFSPPYQVNAINEEGYEKVIYIRNVHFFDFNKVINELKSCDSILIKIEAWVQRIELFERHKDFFSNNLVPEISSNTFNFDNNLLVHIRAGDTLGKAGSNRYFPLPISYYEAIIEDAKLEPVFIGELDNFYGEILKRKFPSSFFISCEDSIKTWQVIRNAKNCAISISTFSWTACFLSKKLEKLYFPVAGLFNCHGKQNQERIVNLIELNNEKINYYYFQDYFLDLSKFEDLSKLLNSGNDVFKKLAHSELEALNKKFNVDFN
jgi:hypothetical protein